MAANTDEVERQMGRGYKGRLQATRAYKQKIGFRLQERTNKREATTGGRYKQKRLQWGATRAYNKEGVCTETVIQEA